MITNQSIQKMIRHTNRNYLWQKLNDLSPNCSIFIDDLLMTLQNAYVTQYFI